MMRGPKVRQSNYDKIDWINPWYDESDGLALQSTEVFPILSQLTASFFNAQGMLDTRSVLHLLLPCYLVG